MTCQTSARGFTLIELIMVLVILGALSVFVAPRFFNKASFDTLSFHQELKTAIRFAHKLSIASGCEIQVALTATTYALFYPNTTCTPNDGFGATPVKHPVESGNFSGTATSGVTIAGFGNFYYTAVGAPSAAGTITLNPGGRTIVINALTGFVQ